MPAAPVIKTEGVDALPVTEHVTLLRGSCRERMKYEIEYALKRGTTENSYLITVPGSGARVLIDIPFPTFTDDWGARGAGGQGDDNGLLPSPRLRSLQRVACC
jgi:hypothetical protein